MSLPSINMFCSISLFIEPVGMADSQTSVYFCHRRELVFPEIKEYGLVTT